jgi:hypothetical protein
MGLERRGVGAVARRCLRYAWRSSTVAGSLSKPAIPWYGNGNAGIRFLTEAGFNIDAQYGDWAGGPFTPTAGEIITIARRV